jgi:hypothetical protein
MFIVSWMKLIISYLLQKLILFEDTIRRIKEDDEDKLRFNEELRQMLKFHYTIEDIEVY